MAANKKMVQLGLRVPEAVKAALEKLAEQQRRPLNTQALILLEKGLIEHGYLEEPKARR